MISASNRLVPRRARRHAASAWIVLWCLLGSGTAAHAQGTDATTRTVARELAVQGAEAYEQKDYATAYDRLSRAFALYPVPSISIMQARALRQLGRLVEALDRFEETRRMPITDDAPEAFRVAIRDAEAESEQLRAIVPRLVIQVSRGGAAVTDVAVVIDGRLLPDVLLNVDCPVNPGKHTIVVKARNSTPVTREVTLSEKDRVVLEVALDAAPHVDDKSNDMVENSSSHDAPTSARKWIGWGAVGGGAAGLVVTAVTGVVALDRKSSLDSKCDPGCPVGSQDEIDGFRSYRTASYWSASISTVLLGVGGYLLLTGDRNQSGTSLGVHPGGMSLVGRF
ncbi:MAG: hypothetical protein QM784_25890 [Polyangiaceae bacterium]